MNRLLYIERQVIAVVLLLLLAVAPAMAQDVAYTGQTTTLEVDQMEGDTYVWELYSDPTVDFATDNGDPSPTSYAEFVGNNSGPTVNVRWKKPGTCYYKVTAMDAAGCAMNLKVGIIEVKTAVTATIAEPDPKEICEGDPGPVTLSVEFTGTGPWDFTYEAETAEGKTQHTITNIPADQNPYQLIINPAPTATTKYTVIRVWDSYGSNEEPGNTVELIVNPLPDPIKIYHR